MKKKDGKPATYVAVEYETGRFVARVAAYTAKSAKHQTQQKTGKPVRVYLENRANV